MKHLKLWVFSFVISILLSSSAFAQDLNCKWVDGFENDIINCNNVVYKVFTIPKSKDLLKKAETNKSLTEKISLLEQTLVLKDQLIDKKDSRIDLLEDNLNFSNDTIAKLFKSPYAKQKFFDKPSVNYILGAASMVIAFGIWEFGRNGIPKILE